MQENWYQNSTLTLAQNVLAQAAKTKHYRGNCSIKMRCYAIASHWPSQSHDKTFRKFIVESRASSLNEFLTLRIGAPKTSDSFSIASLSLWHSCSMPFRIAIFLTYLSFFVWPFLTFFSTFSVYWTSFAIFCSHLYSPFQLLNASIRVFRAHNFIYYTAYTDTFLHITHWTWTYMHTAHCIDTHKHLVDSLIPSTASTRLSAKIKYDGKMKF